jgi:hypothetical protein
VIRSVLADLVLLRKLGDKTHVCSFLCSVTYLFHKECYFEKITSDGISTFQKVVITTNHPTVQSARLCLTIRAHCHENKSDTAYHIVTVLAKEIRPNIKIGVE